MAKHDPSTETDNRGVFERVFKDPLFQFVVIGAVLFSTFQFFSEPAVEENANRIVIDNRIINTIAASYERSWMRKPTKIEMDGMIQDYLKEEILYREALKLGLDKNDTVIRRRLRQKMDFLSRDLMEPPAPSNDMLQEYLEANKEKFLTPPRATFSQVYFKFNKSDSAEDRTKSALENLKGLVPGETSLESFGDATMLPGAMNNVTPFDIAKLFGQEFANSLFSLPVKQWAGPTKSGFGLHLIYIDELVPSAPPTLAIVRKTVEREWRDKQRKENNKLVFQAFRDQYDVEIMTTNQDSP